MGRTLALRRSTSLALPPDTPGTLRCPLEPMAVLGAADPARPWAGQECGVRCRPGVRWEEQILIMSGARLGGELQHPYLGLYRQPYASQGLGRVSRASVLAPPHNLW
jgi:hypothetical protein